MKPVGMCRVISTGVGIVAVLTLAAGVAAAQTTLTPFTSTSEEVEFTRATRVGATVIAPGRYYVQHEWMEGRHYLVVRTPVTLPAAPAAATGALDANVLARVLCRVAPVSMVQAGTGLTTTLEPNGTATLTEVTINGERREHVLVSTLRP